jgi:hypothetical protein
MPAQKKTIVSVVVADEISGGQGVCVLIEMKIGSDDANNAGRCMRDLQRALQTFHLHADIEDKNVFQAAVVSGPYSYNDQKNLISFVRLYPLDGVDRNTFSAKIRTGVHGVGSLLRQGGTYRVKARIKPVEQIPIPGTEGVASAPTLEPTPTQEPVVPVVEEPKS